MSGRGVKTATFENWKKTNKYLQLDATQKDIDLRYLR